MLRKEPEKRSSTLGEELCVLDLQPATEASGGQASSSRGNSTCGQVFMRFFITGAAGYLGSALVRELGEWHHEANGLVRSEEKARQIESMGGRAVLGRIEEPSSYAVFCLKKKTRRRK